MRGPILDRNGVYHYRRRIPDDVRRVLRELDANFEDNAPKQDKREEKKRLGRNLALAQVAWEKHDRAVEAKWAALRSGQPSGLSPVHIQALAGDIHRRWLNIYHPKNPDTGSHADHLLRIMQEMDSEVPREETTPGSDEERLEFLHGDFADAILSERGLTVNARVRYRLILAAQDAAKHACRVAIRKFNGRRPEKADEDFSYPAWPDPQTTTLVGLHQHWAETRKPTEQTKRSYLSCINDLVASVGYDDLTRLSSKDIRGWCNNLRKRRGIGGIRIRDGYLAAVKAVLNCALLAGYIEVNPAASVKVDMETSEEEREKDLRNPEIYAILRGTKLPPDQSVSENVRNARRWVPWLCAYTGARVAEMTRLESRHIIEEEGVDGIYIEKTKTGRMRKVPIHQDLKDQGFLEFVASRRGRPLFFGKEKLAAGIKMTIHKTRAEGLGEWIRTLDGMQDRNVAPNHGWRHRFRTECRRIFMDREVRNYLQGHAVENIGEKYGHVPLDISAPWIEMFPRFDVSGDELLIHRIFDPSLLVQAAERAAELRARALAGKAQQAARARALAEKAQQLAIA